MNQPHDFSSKDLFSILVLAAALIAAGIIEWWKGMNDSVRNAWLV